MKTIDGKPEYKGAFVRYDKFKKFKFKIVFFHKQDVLFRVVRNEGFFALWKGFTPYYARLGPHTVLTFIFLEQANQAYKKYVLKDFSGGGGL